MFRCLFSICDETPIVSDGWEIAVGGLNHGLLLPPLFPGEWLIGYIGRIRVLNGLHPSQTAVLNALKVEAHRQEKFPVGMYDHIAELVGPGMEELLLKHTVVPYRMYALDSAELHWKKTADVRATMSVPTVAQHRFCVSCARREEKQRGGSFWKLSHQYLGVTVCWVCNGDIVGSDQGAFSTLPHLLLAATDVQFQRVTRGDDQAVARHRDLVETLLERQVCFALSPLRHALFRRGRELGIVSSSGQVDINRLSDTAASYLALFEIKDMPSIAHSLERKQSGKWACLALLLAMTSSTEESLRLLEKCGSAA